MRVAIIGPQGSGKSTLVKDICEKWPRYQTPERTYRDAVREQNLQINRKGSMESQKIIRDFLYNQAKEIKDQTHAVVDRTVIDSLVYSVYLSQQPQNDITDEFMTESIILTKNALEYIDIIFMCSLVDLDESAKKDELRDADEEYRTSIDSIFRTIMHDLNNRGGIIFKEEDYLPPIVEIGGTREQRLTLVNLYINEDGDAYENTSLITEEDIKQAGNTIKP